MSSRDSYDEAAARLFLESATTADLEYILEGLHDELENLGRGIELESDEQGDPALRLDLEMREETALDARDNIVAELNRRRSLE